MVHRCNIGRLKINLKLIDSLKTHDLHHFFDIVISVHDMQGRFVTYLENGRKSAGYYKTVWNVSNNASGLYFIHLNAYALDNTLRFNKLQKIMLVK